jgi:hypothetical protein
MQRADGTRVYRRVFIRDEEGDGCGTFELPHPLSWQEIILLRESIRHRWNQIDEGDFDPESETERVAWEDGPVSFFLYHMTEYHLWTEDDEIFGLQV